MKKIILLFVCFLFVSMPAFAIKGVKFVVESCCDFNPDCNLTSVLTFKTHSTIEYDTNIIIPENSILTVSYEQSKKERRFHKSGFFTGRLIKYTKDGEEVNISSDNMKVLGKLYEKVDGKEAAKTGAEFITATAVGLMIPGVDIAYYFVKGAIQNEKADTRLKSGVHNAYDNSILWIFLKGKPIVFNKGAYVKLLMVKDDGQTTDKELEKISE